MLTENSVLRVLYMLSHLILTVTLSTTQYWAQFTGKVTEVEGG